MIKNKIGNLIPSITMIIISFISFNFKYQYLIITGLLIAFPIAFFIEGVICGIKKKDLLIPLIISILIFIVIIFTLLNQTATAYIWIYSAIYIIGYATGYGVSYYKDKKINK